MENADALDLSKENIQPLKKGRNTAQLGLALQAQTDTALHQMLSKKQEWYEMQIRTYEGSDPLELWCEYISWVEQSFPKHGPEGNLSVLLTKCFQAFKDEEKYKNDIRFVRLWIKYIEMQNDSKRVELYHLLNTQGIGLRCAEFYRSWAYEYECVNDWRQAEQIFKRGFNQMAQPAEELHAAHERFLASYTFTHKNINNDSPEEEHESHLQGDQRLPMAALKAVGKKSAAPNVRVGTNVRSQLPGVLPAAQGSSGRPNSTSRTFGVRGNNVAPVAVYQQRGETDTEVLHNPQTLPSAVPIPQSLNKENIVNAGPWTGQGLGSRKHQGAGVSHSYAPKPPGFEVHRDEDAVLESGQDIRIHGLVVPNVLKPRKALEDGFQDAIAIFEEPNPFTKPMYRKVEVYAGGKEFQLEEIHALDYFRKRAEKEKKMRELPMHYPQADQNEPFHRKMMHMGQVPISPAMMQGPHHIQRETPEHYGHRQMSIGHTQDTSYHHLPLAGNAASHSVPSDGTFHQAQQPSSVYATPAAPEVGIHYGSEMSHLHAPHHGLKMHQPNQSMHNQSMTVHTKLAMHEVNNLWASPSMLKPATSQASLQVPPSTSKLQPAFHIMRDDSLPAPLIENSPVRGVSELPTFSPSHFKSKNETLIQPAANDTMPECNIIPVADETTVHTGVLPPPVFEGHRVRDEQRMDVYPSMSSENYVKSDPCPLFEDPLTMTSYMKAQNGFQVYQEAPCPSVDQQPVPRQKFQVFCDEGQNMHSAPAHTSSVLKGDLSSSAHTSGSSVQKIAKEKENIHKFPQADIELMEECGVTPAPGMQMQANHYGTSVSTYAPQPQIQPFVYDQQHLHEPMHSAHTGSNQAMQEPMDDDATVAAAPKYGINMSETGITEAFFFPIVDAASTPCQDPQKKARTNRSQMEQIDFNSSLYRVEQTRPLDSEEDGVPGSERSPDTPKTVPPLKLFRIKNDASPQLSAILETSKEKYASMQSNSRSSISSVALTNSRYGMYTTQRHSMIPQPNLNLINESSEPAPQETQSQAPAPDAQQTSGMAERLAKGDINPFDSRLLEYFLSHMGFPLPQHQGGYSSVNGAVPAKRNNCLNLNGEIFNIAKILGEGAYAKVLKGVHTVTQREVALKVQKPSCRWEYYICREIQHRLSQQNLASAFMPADQIFVYNNGSVIVTDLLPFGTLLTLVNKVVANTKRQMQESQALYLMDQLIAAISALHECKIIHGDLKPDNILLRAIPALNQEPCIQLIDFGRSIDMTLMPSGTTFNHVVMTDTFTCIEMRTGRPWTYQTDLFGLANTAHCLLFGDYMKVQESRITGRWTIQSRLPRNLNADYWGTFFDTLLNIESCDAMPDLETLRADTQACMSNSNQLGLSVSALGRIMLER